MSQAMANAFNQWNQMIIDQQQWNANREMRNQEFQIKSVLMEEQAKDMQENRKMMKAQLTARRYNNTLLKAQVDDYNEYIKPRPVNIYAMAGRNWAETQAGRDDMLQVFKDFGATEISEADGLVKVKKGELLLPGREQELILPMVQFVDRAHTNTPAKLMEKYDSIAEKITDRLMSLRKNQKSPYTQAANGRLKEEVLTLKNDLDKVQRAMTPEALSAFYGKEATAFDQGALYFMGFGAQKASKYLSDKANEMRTMQAAMMKQQGIKTKLSHHPVYRNEPGAPDHGRLLRTVTMRDDYDRVEDVIDVTREVIDEEPPDSLYRKEGASAKTQYKPAQMYDDIGKSWTDMLNDPVVGVKAYQFSGMIAQYSLLQQNIAASIAARSQDEKEPYEVAKKDSSNIMFEAFNEYFEALDESLKPELNDAAFREHFKNTYPKKWEELAATGRIPPAKLLRMLVQTEVERAWKERLAAPFDIAINSFHAPTREFMGLFKKVKLPTD